MSFIKGLASGYEVIKRMSLPAQRYYHINAEEIMVAVHEGVIYASLDKDMKFEVTTFDQLQTIFEVGMEDLIEMGYEE